MTALRKHLQDVFSDEEIGLTWKNSFFRGLFFAMSTLLFVWILKPDLFGLVPNSFDPMFYTGYGINLDDALNAAGNRHYFVSRWTSYMPMYISSEIFGPYWGRLVLRLVLIVVMSEMLWRFGQRLVMPTRSRLIGVFAVATAPMFVRAFTTDYPEYFIIWGSIVLCLLIISFGTKPNVLKGIPIGVLSMSMIIANPFSGVMVAVLGTIGLMLAKVAGASFLRLISACFMAGVTGSILLVVGYFLFDGYYAIGNVYAPTLDFIQTYNKPQFDGWVSPTNEWMYFFPWIYLTPIVVFASLVVLRNNTQQRRVVFFVSTSAFLVFLSHVLLELRSGHALETSYYWSMSLGPVLVLIFFLVSYLAKLGNAKWGILTVIGITALIFFRIPQRFTMMSGIGLFLTLAVFVLTVALVVRKLPALGTAVFFSVFLWMQLGGPVYSIRTYDGELNSPRYDLVYNDPSNESSKILTETLWFLKQMDDIEDDWKSTFLSAGRWSSAIVGTYIPHPFSRVIFPESDERVLAPNVRDELEFGYRSLLVIYGVPQEVTSLERKIKLELPQLKTLIDVTNSEGLGYRLVVVSGNSGEEGNSTISMSRLDRQIGRPNRDGSVTVDTGTSRGFVSFGPYFGLGSGSYSATLLFNSKFKESIGYFEVYEDKTQQSVRNQLYSDGTGMQFSTVKFIVGPQSKTWQLRTVYSGSSEVLYQEILLKRLGND
jgi:hypothetical protein